MIKKFLIILSLFLFSFSFAFANNIYDPNKQGLYDLETEIPVLKIDLKQIKENTLKSESEAKELNLKLEKANVQIDVLNYKIDLYHINFDSQMSSKFWQGFSLGCGTTVTILGLGFLAYSLLK